MGWKWLTSQLLLKIHVIHVTTTLILVYETSLLYLVPRGIMKTRSVQHVRSACLEARTELVRRHGWQQRTAQPHQQVLLEAIVGPPLYMYILPAQTCSQDARICHSCSVVFRAIRLPGNYPPQNGGGQSSKDYREAKKPDFSRGEIL